MAGVRPVRHRFAPAAGPCSCLLLAAALAWTPALGQAPPPVGVDPGPALGSQTMPPPPAPPTIVAVRIEGNKTVPRQKIERSITSKAGRPFEPELVEKDIRALNKTRLFATVDPAYEQVEGGIVVIFRVVERPTLSYVVFHHSGVFKESALRKQAGLKKGDALDPYAVEEARTKLEEHYHSKGYNKATVTILEGSKPSDRGAQFLINEGLKQKIWKVRFEGNTIASDGRLQTQIPAKPPILFVFKGEADQAKIDESVERLTEYYRSLGFFRARVGRELTYSERQNWVTIDFVIDEGPRYKVGEVSVIGNQKLPLAELTSELTLAGGDYFDQAKMNRDVANIQDKYGAVGYVFAAVKPDPRFREEPGQLDLIYRIEEGARYRVGRIDVKINGESPHTKHTAVLDRLTFRTGEIADIRKFRDSERRLLASGIFVSNPTQGSLPKIVFEQPGTGEPEEEIAERPQRPSQGGRPGGGAPGGGGPGGTYRGQSPDDGQREPTPRDRVQYTFWLEPERDPSPLRERSGEGEALRHANSSPLRERLGEGEALRRIAFDDQASDPRKGTATPWKRGTLTAAGSRTSARPILSNPNALPTRRDVPSRGARDIGAAESKEPIVRYQSPTYSGTVAPSGAVGQQPLGRTGPDSPLPRRQLAATAPLLDSAVAPAQYAQPAPGNVYQPPPANVYQPAPTSPPGATSAPQPGGLAAPFSGAPAAPYGGYQPGSAAPIFQPGAGYDDPEQLIPPDGAPLPPLQPYDEPFQDLPVRVIADETQTGRFMVGVGVNSNAGLVGNVVLDEQNFDIWRWPTSWEDIRLGRAWRGAGQAFRIEAAPGTQFQRYLISFREPYLWGTPVSLGVSGWFFNRQYRNWLEERLGGRLSLGYQFVFDPNLSVVASFRGENVRISDPTFPSPPQLTAVVGDNAIYSGMVQFIHDTRDSTFLPTQGHRLAVGLEQAFGDFSFPRATIDGSQHFLVRQRADGSGRHTLSLSTQVGFSGTDTPIFENFFAGGYSTLRGFRFRGAAPLDPATGVFVGGRFEFINSVEYMLPLTADDMLRAVAFCDFGTVEQNITIKGENFRVAPGIGLRITVPALGPAPIALDLAVPVAHAPGDLIQNFSFNVGFSR